MHKAGRAFQGLSPSTFQRNANTAIHPAHKQNRTDYHDGMTRGELNILDIYITNKQKHRNPTLMWQIKYYKQE